MEIELKFAIEEDGGIFVDMDKIDTVGLMMDGSMVVSMYPQRYRVMPHPGLEKFIPPAAPPPDEEPASRAGIVESGWTHPVNLEELASNRPEGEGISGGGPATGANQIQA